MHVSPTGDLGSQNLLLKDQITWPAHFEKCLDLLETFSVASVCQAGDVLNDEPARPDIVDDLDGFVHQLAAPSGIEQA